MISGKQFWLKLGLLIILLIALLLIRNSSFKLMEQDAIAALQHGLSPAWVRFFQFVSNSISFVSLTIPAFFLFSGLLRKRKVMARKGLVILLSIALAGSIGAAIKRTFKEPRPYEVDTRITQWSVGGSNSFPSGHTAEATAAALGFTLILFRTSMAALLSVIWALLIMFSRIILGVHNFTDIAAGITLGCIGMLIMIQVFRHYGWSLEEDATS